MPSRPNVYVIAGPNGAGKTTFAREFLPNYADCRNFVNADLIAAGVSPLDPYRAAFRAGQLMLEEIAAFAKRHADFGFETTLSGRAHVSLLRKLKAMDYAVHFFYLWVRSTWQFHESQIGSAREGIVFRKQLCDGVSAPL